MKEQILSSFVRLIATTPDLQTYTVQKLYFSLRSDISQEALTLAGAWVIGEYGDNLLSGGSYEEEELVQEVRASDVVDLFSTILTSSYATQITSEYIITALMKLTTRLNDPAQIERIRRLLSTHCTSLDVEIQQRAVEYGNLFGYDAIRRGVLEKMPAPEIREEQRVLGEAMPGKKKSATASKSGTKLTAGAKVASDQDMLLDLMGGSDILPNSSDMPSNVAAQNNADLLADILGEGGEAGRLTSTTTTNASIMNLFSSDPSSATHKSSSTNTTTADLLSTTTIAPSPRYPAYSANNLSLTLQISRPPSSSTSDPIHILALFQHTSPSPHDGDDASITNLSLQAAVPKTQKLQLNAISSVEVPSGQTAKQAMRVWGCNNVSLAIVLRIGHWPRSIRSRAPIILCTKIYADSTARGHEGSATLTPETRIPDWSSGLESR